MCIESGEGIVRQFRLETIEFAVISQDTSHRDHARKPGSIHTVSSDDKSYEHREYNQTPYSIW